MWCTKPSGSVWGGRTGQMRLYYSIDVFYCGIELNCGRLLHKWNILCHIPWFSHSQGYLVSVRPTDHFKEICWVYCVQRKRVCVCVFVFIFQIKNKITEIKWDECVCVSAGERNGAAMQQGSSVFEILRRSSRQCQCPVMSACAGLFFFIFFDSVLLMSTSLPVEVNSVNAVKLGSLSSARCVRMIHGSPVFLQGTWAGTPEICNAFTFQL